MRPAILTAGKLNYSNKNEDNSPKTFHDKNINLMFLLDYDHNYYI